MSKVYAICEPDIKIAEKVAEENNCKILKINEIENNPDIDAVIICTPTDTHVDLINRFSKSNKSIFCEKPIDLDINNVKKCIDIVKKNKTKLMVGFNRRFDPHFSSLKNCISKGVIGKIESIIITSRDPSPPPINYIKRSGGIFRDMTIHDFDMSLYLLDELPTEVFAYGSSLIDSKIAKAQDYDTASIILKTSSGKQININNSRRATYGYDQRIEVHGSLGMVSAQNQRPISIEIADKKGFQTNKLHHFFMTRYIEAYSIEIDYFIKCISKKIMPTPNGIDGLNALIIAEAADRSAKLKKPEKIVY